QGVAPTIYGQALLDCGAAVFDDLRQGVKKIEFLADPTEGELRIGSGLPGFGGVVPATIDRFRRNYLRIQIQANILTDPQQQHRALRERTIDFFVGRLPQPIEKDLEFEILFQEGLVVVAGAHNRWARHRRIRLAELAAEPWLLPPFETSAVGSLIAQAF